jgi:photosystem II stability/assembly factor-like uncharacterized protein
MTVSGTNIFAGASDYYPEYGGVYLSTDNGTNWTHVNNGLTGYVVYALAVSGNQIFAAGTYGISRSTNNGTNWTSVFSYPGQGIMSIICSDTNIFAGTYDGRLFRSTNNGDTWTNADAGIPDKLSVDALAANGNDLYAGTYYGSTGGVFRSTNNGTSWAQTGLNSWIISLTFSGNNLYAGTASGLYLSTDKGLNWSSCGLDGSPVNNIVFNANNIYAGTYSVLESWDKGINWMNTGPDMTVYSLAVCENNIFAGTQGKGIWKRQLSSFLTPVEITSFITVVQNNLVELNWSTATETNNRGFEIQRKTSSGEYVTVGFKNGNGTSTKINYYTWAEKLQPGKYSYRLKQTDYNGKFEYSKTIEADVVPNAINLEQNFPNPFNPTTTISFSLPKSDNVKLTVYNAIGNIVATIVNEYKPAGNYSVQFKGSNLASGIYLYRLESGNYSATKKFILMK